MKSRSIIFSGGMETGKREEREREKERERERERERETERERTKHSSLLQVSDCSLY